MKKEHKEQNTTISLLAILLAVFVVPTSISGTAIALPFIASDLSTNATLLQWVVNGFNLTFACFTLLWGSFADNFGRKKSFLVGAVIYTLASLLSIFSINAAMLDVARAFAGIGGAAIFSCGSAILINTFDGKARTKAFALFGTTAGIGITFGPTISGFLLNIFTWRAIFVSHTLVLAVALVLTFFIAKDTIQTNKKRFDLLGAVLFTTALFLFMLSISNSTKWGWLNEKTLLSVGIGCLLGSIFVLYEKSNNNPILNLSLLNNKKYVGLILVPVVASFSFVSLLTYYPSYLTGVMQFSPLHAGTIMVCLTLPVLFCPALAGKLVSSGISELLIIFLSLALMIGGSCLLFLAGGYGVPLYGVAFSLFMVGAGMGLTAGLVDGLALSCAEPEQAGMAAGLLNTLRLGSEAIAVALYGSLLTKNLSSILPPLLTRYNNSIDTVKKWTEIVASGNTLLPLSDVPLDLKDAMLTEITASYHSAFTATLAVLIILSAIITVAIISFLKQQKEE